MSLKKVFTPLMVVIFALCVFCSSAFGAEWLAIDVPTETNITGYNVKVDGAEPVFVPYQLSADGNDVLIWDISAIDGASFEVQAVNDQGRTSAFAPFVLKPKPSSVSGLRVIEQ